MTKAICAILFYLAIIVFCVGGWILNVVHIVKLPTIVFTGEVIVRVVGIFLPPLGAIMGWFF
jgi:hypothetical protein